MTQKRLTNSLLMLPILLVAQIGCVDSNKLNPERIEKQPITFSSNIYLAPMDVMRNHENIWDEGDLISVYMLKSGAQLNASLPVADLFYSGARYKALNRGTKVSFEALEETDKMYFPPEEKVDFVAYYPASITPTAEKMLAIDVVSSPKDLLYSSDAKEKNAQSSPRELMLTFQHALSAIRVALVDENDGPLTDAHVVVKGLKTQAAFSLADGKVSDVKTVADMQLKLEGNYFNAIAIPQTIAAGTVKIAIQYQGNQYEYDVPALDLPQGKRALYQLRIMGNGVNASLSGSILDWTEVSNGLVSLTPQPIKPVSPVLSERDKNLLAEWKSRYGFDLSPFIGKMLCNGTVKENGHDLLPILETSRLIPVRNQIMTVEVSKQATKEQPILSFTQNALGLADYWKDIWFLLTWENREFWNDPHNPYVAPAVKIIVDEIKWTEQTPVEFDVAMPIIKVDTQNKGNLLFTGSKVEALTGLFANSDYSQEQLEEMANKMDPAFQWYYDRDNIANVLQFKVPLFEKAVAIASQPAKSALYEALQQASFSPFQILDTSTITRDTWKDDIDGTQYEAPKGTINFETKEIHIRTVSSLENSGYTLIDITCKALQ